MKMKCVQNVATALVVVRLLGGCTTTGWDQPPNIPVTDVIEQLKYELGVFVRETDGKDFRFPGGMRCGASGTFSMKVQSIEVKLTSNIANVQGADTSLSTAIPMGGVTLAPTGGGARSVTNSQIIVMNLLPGTSSDPSMRPDPNASNSLARALLGLRDQLLAVRSGGQCLKFAAEQPNKITLAFSAGREVKGGIKLNLGVLALGVTSSEKAEAANTVTVTLDFTGTEDFAPKM